MLVSYFLDIKVKITTKLITISGKFKQIRGNNDDMLIKDSQGVILKGSPTEAFKNTYKSLCTIPTEKKSNLFKISRRLVQKRSKEISKRSRFIFCTFSFLNSTSISIPPSYHALKMPLLNQKNRKNIIFFKKSPGNICQIKNNP